VGRERELADLRAALDTVGQGRGGLHLLSGEPGIGKTRLVERVADEAAGRGLAVLWGRCWESGGAPAYWPWVQVARTLLRRQAPAPEMAASGLDETDLGRLVAELSRDHGAAVAILRLAGESTEARAVGFDARVVLFEAVQAVLAAAAARQPTLVVLDDIHAADEPSLLLLQYLAHGLGRAPLLVLATHREWELRRAQAGRRVLADLARAGRQVALRGLTEAEVRRVLEQEAPGGRVPAPLLASVMAATAGNPFFVHELVRLLRVQGRLDHTDLPHGESFVPLRVRETVRRRLELLEPQCQAMLSIAAVVGQEFDRVVVGHVCGQPPARMLDLLNEAAAAGVVAPLDRHRWAFSHGIMREALVESMAPGERARLHARIGGVLEARGARDLDTWFGELAHHFVEAAQGGVEPGKAVAYARQAARHAMRRLAFEEAVAQFEQALLALELDPAAGLGLRAELLLELGHAQRRTGEADAARATFARAAVVARRGGDVTLLARAALDFGGIGRERLGADRDWIALLEEALAGLRDDGPLRTRVQAALAMARFWTDGVARCDALSGEAVAMARRLGDPATLAFALDCRLKAVWDADGLAERIAFAGEMLALAQAVGDRLLELEARRWKVVSLFERCDVSGVDREIATTGRIAEELRDPFFHWQSVVWQAMRVVLAGDLERGEALAGEALAAGERVQSGNSLPVYLGQMFDVRWIRGTLGELAGAIGAQLDDSVAGPAYRCGLSLILADGGDAVGARREIDLVAPGAFAALPRNAARLSSLAVVAQAIATLDDPEHAPTLYRELLPLAGRNVVIGPALGCFGAVDRYLGLLAALTAQLDVAVGHLEAALATHAAMGARAWLAWTQHDLAAVLLRRGASGDRQRAAALRSAALEAATAIGMVRLRERLERSDVSPVEEADGAPSRFVRDGDFWVVRFDGVTIRAGDAKGMRYLRMLLAAPGQELHVLAMAADVEVEHSPLPGGGRARDDALAALGMHRHPPGGDGGPVLDARARAAYRARYAELEAELEEARLANDLGRRERLAAELDCLGRQLAEAVGLGGRVRQVRSPAEKARTSVTRAVRGAIVRLKTAHPALGEHLDRAIRTGTFCVYVPDPRIPAVWDARA